MDSIKPQLSAITPEQRTALIDMLYDTGARHDGEKGYFISNRLISLNADHVRAVDHSCKQFRQMYLDLKVYNLVPTANQAEDIKSRFKTMCSTKTADETLDSVLNKMGNNQHALLRLGDKPYLPVYNKLSEPDIREHIKKRRINGSTLSKTGRMSYAFASLKKTCLKHNISFWHYLKARLLEVSTNPPLSDEIRVVVTCG